YIFEKSREVIIGVTATQFNFLPDNPFTAGERIEMIRKALGKDYLKCYIIPINNVPDNFLWLSTIESISPYFEAVFTNNLLVEILAKKRGYIVEKIPFKNRNIWSGTKIRLKIASGKKWQHLVPSSVAKYIMEIKGDERIRKIFETKRIPLPYK
ncbi:MAG TPA: nicotinamide-nucleotide adenylyltransferase, partial [Thermoprotei archaeon]|nr:nicotinamide-nucleotide adenylyltransferase [Thermoprotei archaeon]